MSAAAAHFAHWPPGLPRHLTVPRTSLFDNAEVSARRYPEKTFIVFYDSELTFGEFHREAECIAGFLQRDCGGELELSHLQLSAAGLGLAAAALALAALARRIKAALP